MREALNIRELRDKADEHSQSTLTPEQQAALLGAIRNEMDRCREAFATQMVTRFYGPVPGEGWTPPVYTRRQRVRWWLSSTINSTRERIALWFAPWLAERDD